MVAPKGVTVQIQCYRNPINLKSGFFQIIKCNGLKVNGLGQTFRISDILNSDLKKVIKQTQICLSNNSDDKQHSCSTQHTQEVCCSSRGMAPLAYRGNIGYIKLCNDINSACEFNKVCSTCVTVRIYLQLSRFSKILAHLTCLQFSNSCVLDNYYFTHLFLYCVFFLITFHDQPFIIFHL